MLGFPHSMVAGFQEQSSKENKVGVHYILMTCPQKFHEIKFSMPCWLRQRQGRSGSRGGDIDPITGPRADVGHLLVLRNSIDRAGYWI